MVVGPRFLHPHRGLRIADKVEKPTEKRNPVTFAQAEARRVRRERVGERAGVVVDGADRVGEQLRHRLRIFFFPKEIRHDARWSRHRQIPKRDPFAGRHRAGVEPYVGAARLTARRDRELVAVGGQMSEAVERGGRPVRDDTFGRSAFPGEFLGSELEPRGSQVHMVGNRSAGKPVDAPRHSFEDRPLCNQAAKSSGGYPGPLRLPARHEAPLVRSDVGKSDER